MTESYLYDRLSAAPFGNWLQNLEQNEQETLKWALDHTIGDQALLIARLTVLLDVLEREKLDLMKQLSNTCWRE